LDSQVQKSNLFHPAYRDNYNNLSNELVKLPIPPNPSLQGINPWPPSAPFSWPSTLIPTRKGGQKCPRGMFGSNCRRIHGGSRVSVIGKPCAKLLGNRSPKTAPKVESSRQRIGTPCSAGRKACRNPSNSTDLVRMNLKYVPEATHAMIVRPDPSQKVRLEEMTEE